MWALLFSWWGSVFFFLLSLLFSCSVVYNSLQPHGRQYTRLLCPSPPPGLLKLMSIESMMPSNHMILCDPPLLPSIFPSIMVFSRSQLLTSCGQSIGALRSASVFPMNIQGWFPLGLTALISLQSKVLSRVFSSTIVWKHQCFGFQPSLWSNSHIHMWLLEKPQLWVCGPLLAKWYLCFSICQLGLSQLFFQGTSVF